MQKNHRLHFRPSRISNLQILKRELLWSMQDRFRLVFQRGQLRELQSIHKWLSSLWRCWDLYKMRYRLQTFSKQASLCQKRDWLPRNSNQNKGGILALWYLQGRILPRIRWEWNPRHQRMHLEMWCHQWELLKMFKRRRDMHFMQRRIDSKPRWTRMHRKNRQLCWWTPRNPTRRPFWKREHLLLLWMQPWILLGWKHLLRMHFELPQMPRSDPQSNEWLH